ncbi:MAG: (Na+)-NQR maturation NqrM [Candidatus Marinimicrobia bacterium]|nr:(Na+)-NQR maturation NqrM [Candidatus Neomarinimicrobiota bacterium]MBT3796408.1 (Na+)-NQR maturation NqrM [Candidatus Neomarinimicrobiota bacterium]MBT4149996.1 (Na+)-NQR maturation NqrM [Candidatus Neomarinimicrobiota bacterium]MBT4318374.1 (Na+)-NQR maturation NqrM [Candidatus Neomarinimicrobiota bacterium]MBT4785089.1 (Na+)-NQR maturation NqrM [Candidatus Neomarinimicrobiota bacterium]
MEFFLSIIVIGLALLGMSIGIIFNRKPLQGSCGGVASDCICLSGGTCDDPSQKPNTTNPI